MCGAKGGDLWETSPSDRTALLIRPRAWDSSHDWTICSECDEGLEGLQNTALPKPDRIHLLSQIRRATIDDQEAVLGWLLGKFGLKAVKNSQ